MKPNPSLVVVALGGNALLRRGEPLDIAHQLPNVTRAARAIADIATDHRLVVTHGNGPQVGLLALQAEADPDVVPYPLDVLGAETEGMIGYLLEQQLTNALPNRSIATLLTQVQIASDDPSLGQPTKPIGPVYDAATGAVLARQRHWRVAADGAGVRHVVPSPTPRRILELPAITALLDAGTLVICAGGGGIPVVRCPDGDLHGVQAVIDKDATAALLAHSIGAGVLLILTDVPAVSIDWGTPEARPILRATPADLRRYPVPAGSMAPKIQAACRFVSQTGGRAAIGHIDDTAALLAGSAGTQIRTHATFELGPIQTVPA
jgi:carbamate kinase